MSYERLTFNLGGSLTREETLEGRPHLVVPCVMMTEGVHTGSDGPGYYPADELEDAVGGWDHMPIVVHHPELNGQPISARRPDVLNTRKVGTTLNTRWDGKQKTEAWLDVEKCDQVDKRVLAALRAGQMVEVSTGLYTTRDRTAGRWKEKPYEWVARDHRPDHLAILPDKVGACSIADGAGLLRVNEAREPEGTWTVLRRGLEHAVSKVGMTVTANELSFSETSRTLCDLLAARFGRPGRYWDGYIESVYPDRVVYWHECKCYQIGYAVKDDRVTLTADPVEVEAVLEYKKKDAATVNAAPPPAAPPTPKETSSMAFDKTAHLAALVASGRFAEADKAWLADLPDERLEKILPPEPAAPAPPKPAAKPPVPILRQPEPAPAAVANAAPVAVPVPTSPDDVSEYVNKAPPQIQNLLRASLKAQEDRRQTLVSQLIANERNQFTKEFLETKEIPELEGLVALAAPQQSGTDRFQMSSNPPMFLGSFAGASGPAPTGNSRQPAEETPLQVPALDFK